MAKDNWIYTWEMPCELGQPDTPGRLADVIWPLVMGFPVESCDFFYHFSEESERRVAGPLSRPRIEDLLRQEEPRWLAMLKELGEVDFWHLRCLASDREQGLDLRLGAAYTPGWWSWAAALRLWGAGWLRLPAQVALNACLARFSERAEEFTSERAEILLDPTTGQGFRCYRDHVAAVRFPLRAEPEPALRVATGCCV